MKSPYCDLFDHRSLKKIIYMWFYNHLENSLFAYMPRFIFIVKLFNDLHVIRRLLIHLS